MQKQEAIGIKRAAGFKRAHDAAPSGAGAAKVCESTWISPSHTAESPSDALAGLVAIHDLIKQPVEAEIEDRKSSEEDDGGVVAEGEVPVDGSAGQIAQDDAGEEIAPAPVGVFDHRPEWSAFCLCLQVGVQDLVDGHGFFGFLGQRLEGFGFEGNGFPWREEQVRETRDVAHGLPVFRAFQSEERGFIESADRSHFLERSDAVRAADFVGDFE